METLDARPVFGANGLAAALVLCNQATPTLAQMAVALRTLYPAGDGPTVADLLRDGWVVPTIDGQRLREPPLPIAQIRSRLAQATATVSKHSEAATDDRPTTAATAATTAGEHIEAAISDRPVTAVAVPITAGEHTEAATNNRPIAAGLAPPSLMSYFNGPITNTRPNTAVTVGELHQIITAPPPGLRQRADAARAEYAANGKSTRYKALKAGLDCVTPAGVFNKRANNEVRSLSGLLVLDFDHLPDLSAARTALLADENLKPGLVLVFTSPSGDGLKAIVWTDPEDDHLTNFRAYADYLKGHYADLGLVPDAAGKDVARACFVPHDPAAWLTPPPPDEATP